MKVNIKIDRSTDLPVPFEHAQALFEDIERTLRRFPKLRKLTPLGGDTWRWDLEAFRPPVGNIHHEVSYGAKYQLDPRRSELRWTPVAGVGNAQIHGVLRLAAAGAQTRLEFEVSGELREIDVPLLMRPATPGYVNTVFNNLVEIFLDRTREAITASPSSASAQPAAKKSPARPR